jgi:hypothetical protein
MYTILELAVLDAGLLGHPDCSRAAERQVENVEFGVPLAMEILRR